MPIYEYKCLDCDAHFEKMQKVFDEPLKTCEKCGGALEKQWSLSGFQFKGAGWYVTDYAGKSKGAGAEKSETSDKTEKNDKSEKSDKSEKTEKTSTGESTVKTESASNTTSDNSANSKKDTAAKKD